MVWYFIINVIYTCFIYLFMDYKLISYLSYLRNQTPVHSSKDFGKGFRLNIYIILCFMGSIMFINDLHSWATKSPSGFWRYKP